MTASASTDSTVEFYWRPGCGFCSSLKSRLDQVGLEYEQHNIWDSPDAAAFVRSVADGNETVPTIRVGERALVNPSPQEVLTLVAAEAPSLLPDGVDVASPGRGAVGRIVTRLLGGE